MSVYATVCLSQREHMKSVNIGNVTVNTELNTTIEFRDALCKYIDPELFFPDERRNSNEYQDNENVRLAKKICGDCKHEIECAAYAIIRPNIVGIWGGTTSPERKAIRRKLNIVGLTEEEYEA